MPRPAGAPVVAGPVAVPRPLSRAPTSGGDDGRTPQYLGASCRETPRSVIVSALSAPVPARPGSGGGDSRPCSGSKRWRSGGSSPSATGRKSGFRLGLPPSSARTGAASPTSGTRSTGSWASRARRRFVGVTWPTSSSAAPPHANRWGWPRSRSSSAAPKGSPWRMAIPSPCLVASTVAGTPSIG